MVEHIAGEQLAALGDVAVEAGDGKTFFMFSYEGIRERTPFPVFATVPTEEQRRGDLTGAEVLPGRDMLMTPAPVRPYCAS